MRFAYFFAVLFVVPAHVCAAEPHWYATFSAGQARSDYLAEVLAGEAAVERERHSAFRGAIAYRLSQEWTMARDLAIRVEAERRRDRGAGSTSGSLLSAGLVFQF